VTAPEIRERIAAIARRQLGWTKPLPAGELASALDSLARITLVVAIEDDFGIALEPEDDAAIRTMDDLVAVLARRLAHAAA
jgi:acyl carrier protein